MKKLILLITLLLVPSTSWPAQVLLISSATHVDGLNEAGDVVGVFDDTHKFSKTEQLMFEIIQIPGISRENLLVEFKKKVTVSDDKREWKYPYSFRGVTAEAKTALASAVSSVATKKQLISDNLKVESSDVK